MKSNIKNQFQQGICRAGVCLMMLSGASSYAVAQDDASASDETVNSEVKRKPEVAMPKYETKQISGFIYDAATKLPVDGARVAAYNDVRYSIMTDEKVTSQLQCLYSSHHCMCQFLDIMMFR